MTSLSVVPSIDCSTLRLILTTLLLQLFETSQSYACIGKVNKPSVYAVMFWITCNLSRGLLVFTLPSAYLDTLHMFTDRTVCSNDVSVLCCHLSLSLLIPSDHFGGEGLHNLL